MRERRTINKIHFITTAILALATSVQALNWGAALGNWTDDAASWGGTEPTASDMANIYGGSVQITAPNNELCAELRLGNSAANTGTLDVQGGTLSNTLANVGLHGVGTVNITGGTITCSSSVNIGSSSTATGMVTVSGSNSTWNVGSKTYVGYSGTAALDILAGGMFSSGGDCDVGRLNGSTGEITVNGAGSEFVGNTAVFIGNAAGAVGEVTVSDGGSFANNTVIYLGNSGDGRVNILTGGRFSVGGACDIGRSAGSTGEVTVNGAGSEFIGLGSIVLGSGTSATGTVTVSNGGSVSNNNVVYIGNSGDGTVSVLSGGTFFCGANAQIGRNVGSTGEVTVDGTGSTLLTKTGVNLTVGESGVGTLNISNGALVRVGGPKLVIDANTDGDSFVYMKNSAMLAINAAGDVSADITTFLTAVTGTDAIKYWDWGTMAWDDITNGSEGSDYTLKYHSTGDLAGYTMLVVSGIPEGTIIVIQ